MSVVVHRDTFEYHVGAGILGRFLAEPDGPWVHDPDVSAVLSGSTPTVPVVDWIWEGDVVRGKTQAEKDTDVAAAAASTAALAASRVKIYDLMSPEELAHWEDDQTPPMGLNYGSGLTIRLHQELTMVQGEVTQASYYEDDTLAVEVVRESISYVRDVASFAQSQTKVIEWMRTDGTPHAQTKTRFKKYSYVESIREGKRRRSNVIDALQIQVTGMLMATEVVLPDTDPGYPAEVQTAIDLGRSFIAAHQSSITNYVEGSIRTLHDVDVPAYAAESIVNAPAAWMDNVVAAGPVTIRDVILSTLDIWS